jgi:hypothetical protein
MCTLRGNIYFVLNHYPFIKFIYKPFYERMVDGMLEEDSTLKTLEDFGNHSEDEKDQLNETMRLATNENTDLTQIMELFSDTEHIFQTGRSFELLGNIENTLLIGETALKRFQGKGLSFAILSFQKFVEALSEIEVDLGNAEHLLNQSKNNLANGMFQEVIFTVKELNDMTPILNNKYKKRLVEMMEDTELGIRDSKKIGADLIETERLLIEAKAYFENDILFDCKETLKEANKALSKARSQRIVLIKEAVGFVERMIADAKSIGANIEGAEEQLDQAKSQFIDEDFHMCINSTIQAEEVTCELIQDQVKKAQYLQKSLDERFKAVTTSTYNEQSKSEDWLDVAKVDPYKIPCRICGESMEYVDRYRTWFCNKCQKYI